MQVLNTMPQSIYLYGLDMRYAEIWETLCLRPEVLFIIFVTQNTTLQRKRFSLSDQLQLHKFKISVSWQRPGEAQKWRR